MRSRLSDDERGAVGAERVAVWILTLVAVSFVVAVVVQPGVIAASPPDATFSGTYDAESNTLRIAHAEGDTIGDGPTSSLVVVVSDSDGTATHNVTWVADDGDALEDFPVDSGDSVAIDDSTVDSDGDGDSFDANATVGFELDEGDTARIVWHGRPLGAPDRLTTTLDTVTIADST